MKSYQILEHLVLIGILGARLCSCVAVNHVEAVVTPVTVVECEFLLLSSFLYN